MHDLHISLLGSARIEYRAKLRAIGNTRALALLAYLAVTGESHTREKLTTLLWPEWDRSKGRAYLRNTLWVIKQAMGDEILDADGAGICLDRVLNIEVDVHAFQRQITACRTHGHAEKDVCAACVPHLTTAIALYRDDFLVGFSLYDSANFDDWQRYHTEHLRGQLAGALCKLAKYHDAQTEWETAIAYARRWLALDTLNEPAHRLLIELYTNAGQWSAARRQYDECVRLLADELHTAPSDETMALLRSIEQRSRIEPARRVERRAEGGSAPTAIRHNLPAPITPLIGRQAIVTTLRKLLQGPEARLVTLTGPGGVGKTRLALHVAHTILDFGLGILDIDAGLENSAHPNSKIQNPKFSDGVFLVSLAPLRESDLVVSAIAQSLDVRETVSQSLLQSLKDFLRNQQILLVLDNFEHLLSAGSVVSALLAAAPHLKVLVTSRERLNLYGEYEVPVPPLAILPEDAQSDPAAIMQVESVRLFEQRALAAKPDFVLNPAAAMTVAEICARLDGLPLAIELVAAQIKRFAPKSLLEQLTVQPLFGMLRGGPCDLPERQRTLYDTVAWSHNLLSDAEQQLFRRLAVFVGGCSREAAWQICYHLMVAEQADEMSPSSSSIAFASVHDFTEQLEALVDKNLLLRKTDGNGEPRYTMLETIHEFGLLCLAEAGEEAAVQRAYAHYFMALAEEAAVALKGVEQEAWLNQMEREHDNLRTAIQWATENAVAEIGLRLGVALAEFWDLRGYDREGYQRLEYLLSGTANGESKAFRARALSSAGKYAELQGEYERALTLLEESLALCQELNDLLGMADVLDNLGMTMRTFGNYAAARRHHQESLDILHQLGNPWREVQVTLNLGFAISLQGEYQAAQAVFEAGLVMARSLDNVYLMARFLGKLGYIARMLGEYETARSLLNESIAVFSQLHDDGSIAFTLTEIGLVAYSEGNYPEARSHLKEGLRLNHEIGFTWGMTFTLGGYAATLAAQGNGSLALRLAAATITVRQVMGAMLFPHEQAILDEARATAQQQLGEEIAQGAWAAGEAMTLDEAVALALAANVLD